MKDRLLKCMQYMELTATRLADEIDVQRSGISHILSGRNQPSYDFISKFMKKYPNIDPEWLILGKGSMLKTSREESAKIQPDLFNEKRGDEKPENPSRSLKINATLSGKESIEVTNVNEPLQIILLYPDGTFKQYTAK